MSRPDVRPDVTRPIDFVDNPRLPGCTLVRQSLVIVTLSATGLLAIWLLIGLLSPGGLAAIDYRVLAMLHNVFDPNDPIGPDWLESAMRDVTSLGSNIVVIIITMAVATLLAMTYRIGPAILLVSAIFATYLLNTVLKAVFDRTRPDFLAQSIDIETSSFPSSHAMMSAVLYLLLAAIAAREIADRRLATALIVIASLLAVAVGATRVYLGAHWPSDVLAGWLLGAAAALAAWQLARSPTPPEPGRPGSMRRKDDLHA